MLEPSGCPTSEDLRRFTLGTLPEPEAQRLERHLDQCADCVHLLSTLQVKDSVITWLRSSCESTPLRDAVVTRLEAKLRALPEALRRAPFGDVTLADGSTAPAPLMPLPEQTQADPLGFLASAQQVGEIGRFGPYRVLKLLGSGGMGAVFLAEQVQPRRSVAVKMLLAGLHGPYRQRFRQEMEVIARLRHPNIVHIYEIGEYEERPYFTMEFVDGGDLAQRLATGPLPAQAAAQLVETLARATQHAHEQGFVHRDLKPSNILLGRDGTAKISDFGLAKSLVPADQAGPKYHTESGVILGTPSFMAPEQAAGGEVGPAADVYALGAILYAALTDRPPFKAATFLETLEQLRTREPISPRRLHPDLSRDLETICLKCLRKEPAQRYGTAQELADDLGRYLRGEPLQARPVSAVERLRKWARRQPALALLVAISGLSLVALIGGGLVYNAHLRAAVAWAQAKEEEARRQHEQAARNYQTAAQALRQMLTRLDSLPEGEVWHRSELRLQLLEDALAFYRTVQVGDDLDPLLRADTAGAYAHTGAIQYELGQRAKAAESLSRAIVLFEKLPPEPSTFEWIQNHLCDCRLYLAMMAGDAGRLDEAERGYRQILALRQQLLDAGPEIPERQRAVAEAELRVGAICQATARWADAEAHYLRARAIDARLCDGHPENDAFREGLATDCMQLGHLYRLMHRPREAGGAFARAEELLLPLLEASPDGMRPALHLDPVYIAWSDFLLETGQSEAAWKRADRAVDLAEGVLRKEPQHAIGRAHAREAHHKRAAACEALGRWGDAVRDWDRAVELDDEPNGWYRRMRRTVALARAGEHARAAAEAQLVAKNSAISVDGLFSLARAVAVSVAQGRADVRLAPAERDALAERYASQALALLRALKARGYFQDAGHARALWAEADLHPLLSRVDYLQLLWTK
jgi:serine/threonine-protein kinase